MNKHITSLPRIIVFLVLLTFITVIASCGTATVDRDARKSETVQIDSFEVAAPGGYLVGGKLMFSLRGTPGAQAEVLITGLPETAYLREIDEGVYEGGLIVHPHMQLFPQDFARATLRKAGQSASADQKLPLE